MKKIIFTFIIFLFVLNVPAQKNSNKNYRNQHEIKAILQQSRNQIAARVISGNHKKAINKFEKLSARYGEQHVILYPQEELIFALATRNFKLFIDSAIHYSPVIDPKKEAYIFNDFYEEIYRYSLTEIVQITEALQQTGLTELEKEVIEIYIHFLFGNDEKKLNKNIRRFKREYTRKLFTDFFNSLKRSTSGNRLNFSAGYTYEGIGEGVDDTYYDYFNFAKVELDGFIKKTYFSFYIGGGFSELTPGMQPLLIETSEAVQQTKASSLKYGIKLGRLLFSSSTVQLYPYLSAGGYELSPPSLLLAPAAVPDPSVTVASSFFTGAGLSCDIVLKKWKKKRMFEPEGYFFLRPNVGYDQFLSEKNIVRKNNFYVSLSFGVSIGSK